MPPTMFFFVSFKNVKEIQVIEGGDEAKSSLNTFKSTIPDIRYQPYVIDIEAAERSFTRDNAVKHALRTKLERSASSMRKEDREARNWIELKAQIEATKEGRRKVER